MQFLKALRSLRGKIILLCCGIAFVASILVGGLNYYRTLDITLNAATESLAAETRLMGLRFQSAYDTVRNEVSIVSRTPPIQGLVRSIANNGVDPKDGSTTELWRKRLEEIFISVKQENPYYTQMRYIGLADEGRELVRVNRADDSFYPVPIHELQQKAIEPYVQAVLQGRDTFFFSKVTLNREHGKIDEELIPTIRAVMPVKDVASDKLYGLLVINMAFEALMKRMFNVAKPTKHSFVTNQLGDYIEYDPQTGDLHFEYHDRITKKQPEFIKKIQEGMLNKTLQGDEALFEEGEDFIYYVRMGIDKSTDTEYVGAILRVPRDELLAGVRKTRRETILLTIALVIASIFVAALIAHKLTGPLVQMTRNISKIEDSNKDLDLPVAFQDEIGELARAFQETITRLTRSEATRQAYVDASGDGYWDWMIQQDYEYMSPRFWEMLGYKPEEKKHKPSEWQ
ncbi:MAG: HAMP domain-containing protein, partial [Gammaproteobacteria bacterium]